MKNIVNDLWLKSLKTHLEQYLYWQMEATENMLNGDFSSILPQTFMTEKMFQISKYRNLLGDKAEGLNWHRIYQEASEKARKNFLDQKVLSDEQ